MEIKGLIVVVLSTLVLSCLATKVDYNALDALLRNKVEGEKNPISKNKEFSFDLQKTIKNDKDEDMTNDGQFTIPGFETQTDVVDPVDPKVITNPIKWHSGTSDSTSKVTQPNFKISYDTLPRNNDPIEININGKIIKVDPDTMEPILDSKSQEQEIHHSSSEVGTIYTRWGKTSCPATEGTSLVYDGYAAGSNYKSRGGGANYLCITKAPKYHDSDVTGDTNLKRLGVSRLNGATYQHPFAFDGNMYIAPCAVCRTSMRSVQLMIPGQFQCPDDSWTEEYNGYLMSGLHQDLHTYSFECVDRNMEAIENSDNDQKGAVFYHVGVKCNYGLPCTDSVEFKDMKPLTCVVCTK